MTTGGGRNADVITIPTVAITTNGTNAKKEHGTGIGMSGVESLNGNALTNANGVNIGDGGMSIPMNIKLKCARESAKARMRGTRR